ncbi:NAD+ synthase [Alicyclobacillus sp. ALC3]|uniref:NAD+ synthase n=1 Tax=Alicyclobacillus sp. ALC3 TaxID=2796143 RepID=UPI00237855C9|nr:NAD+ synthase [Alicyclobacillus sp. ALC3]WDL96171.1 NAD+ synthase [Alicyclobacillus sp. ALC3]
MKEAIARQLTLNSDLTIEVLVAFIREEVQKTGLDTAVFGLSGGIDSALVAYLATQALGRNHVRAVLMPYQTSSQASLSDAEQVVNDLDIPSFTVPITASVDAYFDTIDQVLGVKANALRRGNRMARARMATLFDLSAHFGALVLGTSNKTELLLGYGTQFGDLASALNPVGDLYKFQVRQLSKVIGVPQSILDKAPSADLWEDQTDEQELGFSYDEADELLFQLVDLRVDPARLVAAGARPELVETICRRIARNHYKRKPPIIAKVSNRTIGIDFRYLRDWGQ